MPCQWPCLRKIPLAFLVFFPKSEFAFNWEKTKLLISRKSKSVKGKESKFEDKKVFFKTFFFLKFAFLKKANFLKREKN